MMEKSLLFTTALNGSFQAVLSVLQGDYERGAPRLVTQHRIDGGYCGVVGLLGDFKGRLIVDMTESAIKKSALSMYGMEISDPDMFVSFSSELVNMIAGNACTNLSNGGIHLDITPPTLMYGSTSFLGFPEGVSFDVFDGDERMLTLTVSLEG